MKNTYIIDTKDLINIGKVETINKEKKYKKISNHLYKTGNLAIILFIMLSIFIGFNIKYTIIIGFVSFAILSFISFTFFIFSTPYIFINNHDYIMIGTKKLGNIGKINVKIINEIKNESKINEIYQNYINKCKLSTIELDILSTLLVENFEGTLEECIRSVKILSK